MHHGHRGRKLGLFIVPTSLAEPTQLHSIPIEPQTSFTRLELNLLFNIYGQNVAAGEWRDYAIDCLKERAVFSIFKRSGEAPLYRIEKSPRLANKQGAFSVITTTGHILKRGHDLAQVLGVLRKKLSLVQT